MAKIAVLGSGIMATALSFPASENGNEVRLVGTFLDREIIDSIRRRAYTRISALRSTTA